MPVIFAIDRAGIVGSDGPTHHGVFDIAYQLLIPNLMILAPKDGSELRHMLRWSTTLDKPISIRYRGSAPIQDTGDCSPIELAKSEILFESKASKKIRCFNHLRLLTLLNLELKGINSAVINLRFAKPLDKNTILEFAKNLKRCLF